MFEGGWVWRSVRIGWKAGEWERVEDGGLSECGFPWEW